MYNAIELKNLKIKPKINDISLDVLREFYELFLYPFIYTYTIVRNDNSRTISLRFDIRNFAICLELNLSQKKAVKYVGLHNYKGEDGWNNIKSGVLDIKQIYYVSQIEFTVTV